MKKLLPLLWLLITSFNLPAQVALTTEHVDIGLGEGPALEPHWHDEDNDAEYEPGEAFAYINPTFALNARPAGSQWDFLGVNSGEDIYILPQNQNPNLLFLGVGAEEVEAGFWSAWNPGDARGSANTEQVWLRLSLVSVSGPGDFSVWQTDGFGSPIVYMSTAATPAGGNQLHVLEGGHSHYNWGFSAPGTYDVLFEVSAWNGTAFETEQATFTFSTVPEPSTYLLLFLGLGAVVLWQRQRRKNAST